MQEPEYKNRSRGPAYLLSVNGSDFLDIWEPSVALENFRRQRIMGCLLKVIIWECKGLVRTEIASVRVC